jgi:hypothetical protein
MTNPPPPPGWRPEDWPRPDHPYGGNRPQPPPRKPAGGETVGAAVAGVFLYLGINAVIGPMTLFGLANVISPKAAFAIGAVVLASIAFVGGGAMLVAKKTPWARGIGMGLMIGWALTSIFTVGICTGLNPMIYHIGR